MTAKEILSTSEQITQSLDHRELKTAFDALFEFAAKSQIYLFQDKLFELQDTYRQLLHYYVAGTNDPMRQKIFYGLMASVYDITDKITQKALTVDAPGLYFSIRRTLAAQPDNMTFLTKTILSDYNIQNTVNAEALMMKLFKAIWTSVSLTDDDVNGLKASFDYAENAPFKTIVNCQIVSALTLGIQALFDKQKILLLFHAAESQDEKVKIRAYIGILITLYLYQHRIDYYPEIKYRIDALAENVTFRKTVYMIILRFIMSRDTEKITAKMKEEILPEMMKLNPKNTSPTFENEGMPEFFDIEMNPEWIEKFEKSPLGKKLEEFSRLQEEGADVMHFSFVNLKHFPFFNEINNWFLPFHTDASFMREDNVVLKSLGLMTEAGLMCNSDLFSFYFSIRMIQDEGRRNMLEQLEYQLTEWKQQKNADLLTRDTTTERYISHYVQDLYRFYKLFSRRDEFQDIFAQPFDFHNLPVLKRYFSDQNDLLNIAEYYLRKNYFEDALTIFNGLSEKLGEDEMLFQKKGYCLQMTGNYTNALGEYEKAELINPDSKWLIRRIAQCFRAVKNSEKALDYYFRLEKKEPDNLSLLLNIGSCYLDMKNYAEALKYYFKVDYLNHESGKAWRPIAWCSFLSGKYEQAQNYYRTILASNPSYQDYTNAGHTAWALNRTQTAFDHYLKSIQTAKNNFDLFHQEFSKDIPALTSAGINPEEIPFMLDKLRFAIL